MRRLVATLAAGAILGTSALGVGRAEATVVGNGSASSCSSAAVVAAVSRGGTISFDCGRAPVTIAMRQTAKVRNTSRAVILDGAGRVTLSRQGARRILYMNTCDRAQIWTTSHCQQQGSPELVVRGLTFKDGDSRGDGAGGGAIYAFGGRLLIEHARFIDNRCGAVTGAGAGAGGGAVAALWQEHAHPAEILDSAFIGNVCDNPGAGGGGGAVFESQGGLVVRNSTFRGNHCAPTGPDVGGGAVRVFIDDQRPVTVARSRFSRNVCSNGGALSSIQASWTISGSSFSGNRAIGVGANPARAGTPGGGSGGAIYNDGNRMRLSLLDSTLRDNLAREGGGAVFFVSDDRTGTMSITASRLIANPNHGFQTSGLPGIFFLGAHAPTIRRSVLRP